MILAAAGFDTGRLFSGRKRRHNSMRMPRIHKQSTASENHSQRHENPEDPAIAEHGTLPTASDVIGL